MTGGSNIARDQSLANASTILSSKTASKTTFAARTTVKQQGATYETRCKLEFARQGSPDVSITRVQPEVLRDVHAKALELTSWKDQSVQHGLSRHTADSMSQDCLLSGMEWDGCDMSMGWHCTVRSEIALRQGLRAHSQGRLGEEHRVGSISFVQGSCRFEKIVQTNFHFFSALSLSNSLGSVELREPDIAPSFTWALHPTLFIGFPNKRNAVVHVWRHRRTVRLHASRVTPKYSAVCLPIRLWSPWIWDHSASGIDITQVHALCADNSFAKELRPACFAWSQV